MTDISLVPTNELLDALKARFDYFIFAGVQDHHTAGKDFQHLTAWHGHVTFCAGLASELIQDMYAWAHDPDEEEREDG